MTAVASRARSIGNGHAAPGAVARARVRARVRGLAARARLDARRRRRRADGRDRSSPPGRTSSRPLIADAYGLTERERAVTQLVAQGLSTSAIAGRLHLSPWTVQDHLKSIFEKVGVGTRGELIARMFFEHCAPRLFERAPLGPDGWFAPAA